MCSRHQTHAIRAFSCVARFISFGVGGNERTKARIIWPNGKTAERTSDFKRCATARPTDRPNERTRKRAGKRIKRATLGYGNRCRGRFGREPFREWGKRRRPNREAVREPFREPFLEEGGRGGGRRNRETVRGRVRKSQKAVWECLRSYQWRDPNNLFPLLVYPRCLFWRSFGFDFWPNFGANKFGKSFGLPYPMFCLIVVWLFFIVRHLILIHTSVQDVFFSHKSGA